MRKPRATMNPESMRAATLRAKEKVRAVQERARELAEDPRKERRLEAGLCAACFYAPPRLGGAAMTNQECMCCGEDQLYGSTCTDVLCEACAKETGLCKRCGGDMEMGEGRSSWPRSKIL